MPTWVLILIVSSTLAGKPVLGPAGATAVPGYTSVQSCEEAAQELIQKDATDGLMKDAQRPVGEPDRYFVQIDYRCIPGPAIR
jgi:hypothetical protein